MTKSPTMAWGGEDGGFTSQQPFNLNSMYGSRDPSAYTQPFQRTSAMSGEQPMATPTAPTPYTPKKGIFQEYNFGYGGGDYEQLQTPREKYDNGMWKADPNVDYGQAPEAGFHPVFDREGNHYGWEEPHSFSTGGSGLFGDFGKTNSWRGYYYDEQGNLKTGGGSVTPSKSSMTNFMSYAMPVAMAAGLGAGAAGGAFSGTAATGATGGTTAGTAAGAGGGGLSLEAAALLPEAAGAVSGTGAGMAPLYGGVNGTAAFSGLSSIGQLKELVGQGMSVMDALKLVQGGSGQPQGGTGGGGAGGMGILDMLGAYYSGQQMKDMSGNLKGIYSDLTNRQDQFRNQLLKSYEDPNQFYGSNQWKGLESVYQNSVDRGAAKSGTLANPTDRERLLQSYAMKELENYRDGLRQSAGMTKPESALGPLAEGYKAEAYANTAPFAAASRGGTGANITDTWNTIKDVGSTAEDVWKFISSWFD